MAANAIKTPLIRHVSAKGFGPVMVTSLRKLSTVKSSKVSSGISAAVLDNNAPITNITVAFKAGARHEPAAEPGVAHLLRSAAGLTTAYSSGFITQRKLSQMGALVTVSGDREIIYYTLQANRDYLDESIKTFGEMISEQEFRHWELTDDIPRLKYDLACLPPQVLAVDYMHKAAFHRGVGNSLFVDPALVNSISADSLSQFAKNHLTVDRCVISVVGNDADKAELLSKFLALPAKGMSNDYKNVYYGGDLRKNTGGELAHVALGFPGAAASAKEALALAVAAKALGSGPVTKWGRDNSPIAKAIGNIGPFACAGYNVSYSDTGLFGAILSVPRDEAAKAVEALYSSLKSAKVSAESVKIGKNQLKLQVLSESESAESAAESLAAALIYQGQAGSAADIAKQIDAITENDVNQAIKTAVNNPVSLGATGNTAYVPFANELK